MIQSSSRIEKNYIRKPRRRGYTGVEWDYFSIPPYRELRYIDPDEYLSNYYDDLDMEERQEEYAS